MRSICSSLFSLHCLTIALPRDVCVSLELQQWLSDNNFDLNPPVEGETNHALNLAFGQGHLGFCKELLACGHSIIARNKLGDMPVVHAAYAGRLEVAKWAYEIWPGWLDEADSGALSPLCRCLF